MTGFAEYTAHDAIGLAELVRRREVSAHEVLEAALAAIAATDPRVHAVVADLGEQARETVARGLPEGPFTGVPLMIKDFVINHAGVPTRSGSRLFERFVPDHDSTLMARLRRAGFVTVAKTSTPELGLNANCEAVAYGEPTRNPWALDRIAGGSSGGSAAAVAAGMVPLAHANDGGGSIRIPAACNGVFGLKPSRGRVPLGPDVGDDAFAGLAAELAVARSVRDVAALLDAVAGPDPGATFTAPAGGRGFLAQMQREPRRLRIAVATTLSEDVDVHPDCRRAVMEAAELCEALGHDVVEASPRVDRPALVRAWTTAMLAWLALFVDGAAALLGLTPGPDNLEAVTWSAVRHGRELEAVELAGAQMQFNALSRAVAAFFGEHDVLLTPVLAGPPPQLGAFDQNEAGVDAWAFVEGGLLSFAPHCAVFNVTGQPAASVPLHWNADGLPIGVHLASRYGEEGTLLQLAAQLERARPWFDRRPPVSA